MVATLRLGSRRRQIWRRRVLALVALIGVPVLVIAAWPLATRVIEHFELPLRYAPFFGKLADLWGMPAERVREELTRARDASRWSRTPISGLKTFERSVSMRCCRWEKGR